MGSYLVNTPAEQQAMLAKAGYSSIRELYRDVPQELLSGKLNLPAGLSELELRRKMEALASQNTVFTSIFRGAGAYDHFIPAIVRHVTSKEEFVTAYTPYQAEISQGLLQSIFEYQTMICELTGLDVSNASVYDGATAAAEAAAMCKGRQKQRVLLSAGLHPDTIATVQAYSFAAGDHTTTIPLQQGLTTVEALNQHITEDAACLIVQQPNYYGLLEDLTALTEAAHQQGVKVIVSCSPISLGLLQSPADAGADIAVGDGQPLGLSLAFGGPYLGFLAAKQELLRQLPGRIVGQTVDQEGQRAFVLTLQAREQHIKREKAGSSICSNQALCALTAACYLSALGPNGLAEVARQCYRKAHYAAAQISALPGFSLRFKQDFFHEFVTESPVAPTLLEAKLAKQGILAGLAVEDDGILWCVTENQSKEQIDHLVEALKEVAQ